MKSISWTIALAFVSWPSVSAGGESDEHICSPGTVWKVETENLSSELTILVTDAEIFRGSDEWIGYRLVRSTSVQAKDGPDAGVDLLTGSGSLALENCANGIIYYDGLHFSIFANDETESAWLVSEDVITKGFPVSYPDSRSDFIRIIDQETEFELETFRKKYNAESVYQIQQQSCLCAQFFPNLIGDKEPYENQTVTGKSPRIPPGFPRVTVGEKTK